MATIHIEPDFPQVTPAQSLTGWHREFCVELLGEGVARIFVRAVEESSFKATELQRGILFQRLDARFTDLARCIDFIKADLAHLPIPHGARIPTKTTFSPPSSTTELRGSAYSKACTAGRGAEILHLFVLPALTPLGVW